MGKKKKPMQSQLLDDYEWDPWRGLEEDLEDKTELSEFEDKALLAIFPEDIDSCFESLTIEMPEDEPEDDEDEFQPD